MKKFAMRTLVLAMFAALLLGFGFAPTRAYAAETASGICGENLTWVLDENGMLIISGTGPMDHYDCSEEDPMYAPWESRRSEITKVLVVSGVTDISDCAFCGCTNLTSVTIPSSVTAIGEEAFYGCRNLKNVYYEGTQQQRETLQVGMYNEYLTSATWSYGVRSGTCGENLIWVLDNEGILTISGTGSMDYFENSEEDPIYAPWNSWREDITQVVISVGVTDISGFAFYQCTALTSVTIPDTVTEIGEEAFGDCSSLTSVTIPGSVEYISYGTFKNCTELTSVTIEEGVESIGMVAFGGCTSLRSIQIPESVTAFANGAFNACHALVSVKIPSGVTYIPNDVFSQCSSLTSIVIPDGVYTISYNAFDGCSALRTIVLPVGPLSVYEYAFDDCDSLEAVFYKGTEAQKAELYLGNYRNDALLRARWYYNYQELKIVTQPKSVAVAEGEMAVVAVKATGDGLTYRWYYKDKGASSYTYTSSYKTNTYKVQMNDARDGRQLLCRVYDKYGNVVQTNTVKLTMRNEVQIVTQPKSVTVAEGEMAIVTVGATGDGLTYRWYYKDAGASSYTYTSSFTGNTYKVSMNAARNGRQLLCRVYDQYGNVVQTNTVKLSMEKYVQIVTQPVSVTVAEGQMAIVTVGATGDGLTYRWYYKDAGASSYTYTSSFKGNTYKVAMNAARSGRQLLCRVYDQYGNVVQTKTVVIKMK